MERMGACEFLEWLILEQIEPYGEKANYLRAGISFDYEKGIGKSEPQPSASKQHGEIQVSDPDGMNDAMRVFAMLNPGKIRMKPKSKPN